MKLSSHLIRLVLFAMDPPLLFAAALIFMLHRAQIPDQENALVQAAHTLCLDIDRVLLSSMQTLHALATSEHLDSGDFNLKAAIEEWKRK